MGDDINIEAQGFDDWLDGLENMWSDDDLSSDDAEFSWVDDDPEEPADQD